MKQFDTESISSRLLQNLSNVAGWTQIITDSAITSLINAIAESEAETVRYIEYLLQESKWAKAQNMTSLLAQTPYLGYTPRRKVSSIDTDGFVISHDSQLTQAGVTNIFGMSDLDTYLSDYTGTHVFIPKGTSFSTTSGINFISLEDVSYDALTPGGDTTKYMIVPIVQGIQKSVSTTVLGNPFETVIIESSFVESALGLSENFFSVNVTAYGSTATVTYTQVEDIFLAGPTDTAYDVQVAPDFSYVSVRFGNGIVGTQLTSNATVTISYLETLGSAGNVNENFTIINIVSTLDLPVPFYCTNFTSALGGEDEESIDSVRGAAPSAYLTTGGSIITADAYKAAIESISDIKLATVYSGTYIDPITNTAQGSIIYSAIKVDGTAPDSTTFPQVVDSITLGKVSPLDYSVYVPPQFLHLKLNIQGKTISSTTNISDLVNTINTAVYNKYGTLSQTFKESFDNSGLVTYVNQTYSLANVTNQVEAVVDLPPSTFEKDAVIPNYYTINFYFDRSYVRFKGFSDGVLHALKIQIYFNCPECQYNGNSYSRTLFITQTPNTINSYTVNFTLDSPTTGNISVCGETVALAAGDIVSAITIASKIQSHWASVHTNPINPLYNYTISTDTSFPGVLYISPNSISVAPPTMGLLTATGIEFIVTASITWQILQYPYISNITDYNYMANYALNSSSTPKPIDPTDITTPYIPIFVNFDYTSLNPADITSNLLGSGTIKIPNYLPVGTNLNYINFAGASPTLLDEQISIQVIAQPFVSDIAPYYSNNIVRIDQVGTPSTYIVNDITTQVTYA